MKTIPNLVILLLVLGMVCCQADPTPTAAPALQKYFTWLDQLAPGNKHTPRDPAIEAAVDSTPADDEVAANALRGGPRKKNLLQVPPHIENVRLQPLTVLPNAGTADDFSQYDHTADTIFRRITDHCFEAWTAKEGWLFDLKGKMLNHVTVPRRDGDGHKWFGAFLPSGMWITTNLWADDRQINCFSHDGKWLWELTGVQICPRDGVASDESEMIHWARSDKQGEGWIVDAGGADANDAWVSIDGKSRPLSGINPWQYIYPRAMMAKGVYCELRVRSDDSKLTLTQLSAGHGNYIDFPTYCMEPWKTNLLVPYGDAYFGFWPKSHCTWVEGDNQTWTSSINKQTGFTESTIASDDRKIWFINEQGRYMGELSAGWLGDSADGKSLLFKDKEKNVIQVTPSLKISARSFTWKSGQTASPIILYDDLSLGFFRDESGKLTLARW